MGHVQTVERLLQEKVNINYKNKVYHATTAMTCQIQLNTQAGCTLLYLASLNGHIAIVGLLIGKKANVNMCDKVLLYACKIYGLLLVQ